MFLRRVFVSYCGSFVFCRDGRKRVVCRKGWDGMEKGISGNRISANWAIERDSAKDQAVVFIFMFATVGLLIYAAIRPWVEK